MHLQTQICLPVVLRFFLLCLEGILATQSSLPLEVFAPRLPSLKGQTELTACTATLISFLKINFQYALSALSDILQLQLNTSVDA